MKVNEMTVTTLISNRELSERSVRKFHGFGAFVVLVTNDGEIVPAKLVDGKYGKVWLVTDSEWVEDFGRKWIPADSSHVEKEYQSKRSRVQVELGLFQAYELAEARISRKGGDIVRVDWVEYGNWMGNPHADENDTFLNDDLLQEVLKEG